MAIINNFLFIIDIMRYMSLKGLFRSVKMPQVLKKLNAKLAVPRLFEIIKQQDEEHSWKPIPYHHLTIENEGACPGQFCRASVNLTLQKLTSEPITVIWDHVNANAFASKPAFLLTSKPYSSGFAIKFWQWIDLPSDYEKIAIIKQKLVERVLIIFVNYTDVQVINASQSDIIQLCHGLDCQPNLSSRKYYSSIAVQYVNDDEFPELISYWSSYDSDSGGLISKVQVVKMDSIMSNLIRGNI